MGTTDWADIFTTVSADPDRVNREFVTRDPAAIAAAQLPPAAASLHARPPRTGLIRQLSTVARRKSG